MKSLSGFSSIAVVAVLIEGRTSDLAHAKLVFRECCNSSVQSKGAFGTNFNMY